MNKSIISLSDFAAYLADELDAERRDELTRFFADNPDARELLQMSFEAWKTSRSTLRPRAATNGPLFRRGSE